MASGRPLHFVVLGGGMSGLTAAHTLMKHAPANCRVTLLEASSRCGGWVQSTKHQDGAVFEHGPRGIRPFGANGAAVLKLVNDVGLASEVIPSLQSSKAGAQRYIYRNSKLVSLPTAVLSLMMTKGPLSHRLYRIIINDLMTKRKQSKEDESVFSFFKRRFGTEAAEYLSDPFCRGIFAGDCRQLSMQACFPMLVDLEQQYRSVAVGALLSKEAPLPPESQSPLGKRALDEKWRSWTLRDGLQSFASALECRVRNGGVNVQLDTSCASLQQTDGKLTITTNKGKVVADHVISSLPAHQLQSIVGNLSNDVTAFLRGIPFATCAVVNLGYVGHRLHIDGFGFLVPSSEDLNVLGIIFDSCTFPELGSSSQASTQLTVMMGGTWFNRLYGNVAIVDRGRLQEAALDAVERSLGISGQPETCIVSIMANCIPQYQPGHLERLAQARQSIVDSKLPLTLAGASYDGVGIPDVVFKTQSRVKETLKSYQQ